MLKQVAAETVAEAYLEVLASRGVEYFFGSGGTDFGPIVEAYAKRLSGEQLLPRPITVPHEVTTVAMGHGYAMVTGRPQVVMVHTIPGTANAVGGLINAARGQVPMLFSAGRNPLTEGDLAGSRDGGIHWAQESFDQGSMVREWVKWDYELRHGADVEAILDRALAISQSAPAGPVYLTLPREVLAHRIPGFTYADRPRMTPSAATAPDPEAIAQTARVLAAARNPIAIARSLGRDPEAVQPLVELAELLGMPVFEAGATHVNFPRDHGLHAGFDAGPHLGEADVVLVLEADVPWTPKRRSPRPEATVIAIGQDPLFSRYVVRGFPADVALAGQPRLTLAALVQALRSGPPEVAEVRARRSRWEAEHRSVQEGITAAAAQTKDRTPIHKAWASWCVAEILDESAILLNELGIDANQIGFTAPGSYYGVSPAGVLGWGLGAALGAKLASPDKTIISCVGDGSYIFGSPEATHWVSRAYDLPVLWVVFNNSGWNAVANATQTMYPEGWAMRTRTLPFTDLAPSLQFEMICQSAGGYGEEVRDPATLPAALRRALRVVREEKRQALVNIIGHRP
ncbi:MAG: thiamine pyrophosphate-requiring protein [Chloroflexi bacterium]|nr:thiamine pyrophosphate-requiring protein [Chloroflexota bacterium]